MTPSCSLTLVVIVIMQYNLFIAAVPSKGITGIIIILQGI